MVSQTWPSTEAMQHHNKLEMVLFFLPSDIGLIHCGVSLFMWSQTILWQLHTSTSKESGQLNQGSPHAC